MRGGKKSAKNYNETGWTTMNESEEYVLNPVHETDRNDAASSKATFTHASQETV
jgi:hypothetical protein